MPKTIVYLIYDSIGQAIFESQVFKPLIARLDTQGIKKAYIISFEQSIDNRINALQKHYCQKDPRITCFIFKRQRFIHTFLLNPLIQRLKNLLKTIPAPYNLIARGPFAGFIAQKAKGKQCSSFIIQARGLVAEEYAYCHKTKHGFTRLAHLARYYQFWNLEREVYQNTLIETITPALRNYLKKAYGCKGVSFINATFDLPQALTPEEKKRNRVHMRTLLGIDPKTPVYLYNGSIKPWQCPQETIEAFKQLKSKDPRSFFIGLTPEKSILENLLQNSGLPQNSYLVRSVAPEEVLSYLCAADYGFLLRENHIMNWVSRPTKLLEYQAADLTIVHNHTIELLSKEGAQGLTVTKSLEY